MKMAKKKKKAKTKKKRRNLNIVEHSIWEKKERTDIFSKYITTQIEKMKKRKRNIFEL